MGLGISTEKRTTYLVIAGGKIWDRKAEKDHPNYMVQEWKDLKGVVNERVGAAYDTLSGKVTDVYTKVHPEYGEALYVTLSDGGEKYTLNIKTNTANSQHMMKALLTMDLSQDILTKPYDYIKGTKRKVGISFVQNGTELDLYNFKVPKEWETDKDFWKVENRKKYLRWLEDFSDYLVSEIESKVIPKLSSNDMPSLQEDSLETLSIDDIQSELDSM